MNWCWSWTSSTLATSCEEVTHWKRRWCWEGLGAGGAASVPELGRFPGLGNGNLLQYSCLEKSMDRGVWQVTIHAVMKSRTQLDAGHWRWLDFFDAFISCFHRDEIFVPCLISRKWSNHKYEHLNHIMVHNFYSRVMKKPKLCLIIAAHTLSPNPNYVQIVYGISHW